MQGKHTETTQPTTGVWEQHDSNGYTGIPAPTNTLVTVTESKAGTTNSSNQSTVYGSNEFGLTVSFGMSNPPATPPPASPPSAQVDYWDILYKVSYTLRGVVNAVLTNLALGVGRYDPNASMGKYAAAEKINKTEIGYGRFLAKYRFKYLKMIKYGTIYFI